MEGLSSHTLWKLRMMKRASTGGKDESYEHVLMCLICRSLFDDYDHQPKFLPCHHTFCKDCLREYCRQIGDEIECPSCRKIANIPAAGVAALQTNFYVKYIQSLASGSGGQSSHSLECSKHAKEKLQFYCKDCEKSICKECWNEGDIPCLKHDKVPITKITEESHQTLDASFSSANATIEEKKVRLEKLLKALAEEKDSALLKIDSTFEQHAHTLSRRATLLKNKVIDIYNEHVEKLESDLMEISTALTCIVSLKDYHEDKISHGDYKEFAKGIEEIAEVDKNIAERVHPVETHIIFEGGHGSDKYRACAKDLGRVKFNRMVSMPRSDPEGNDNSAGLGQASGSVPSSPIESPKHEASETPTSPTQPGVFGEQTEIMSPAGTPNSPGEPVENCLSGSGQCNSESSTPRPSQKEPERSDLPTGETLKSDEMNSSMTRSQIRKNTQPNVCDVPSSLSTVSNSTNNNNNNNKQSRQSPTPGDTKVTQAAFSKSQLTPPKQVTVMNMASPSRTENLKESMQSPSTTQSKSQSPATDKENPQSVQGNTEAEGIAVIGYPTGGKSRPRKLLMSYQPPSPPEPTKTSAPSQTNASQKGRDSNVQKKPQNTKQAAISTANPPKSPKEGLGLASGGQSPKPSRLPGLSGLCRIPKPKGPPSKVQADGRKGPGVMGLPRRSPTGQRLSPSGQSCQGNLQNNGNNPKAQKQILVPLRNANGNITMQPIPEGMVNANDGDKAKAEKEYYHLLYTSYDEEELLKELKSGKANLDDSDSWMTISSGDESNSTNCSDEALVEADQTTF